VNEVIVMNKERVMRMIDLGFEKKKIKWEKN
jgi:hypothetical protein